MHHGPPPVEINDEYWMQRALERADVATSHHDVPIGAVVVHESGQVLGLGENRREIDADPTAHAELLALRHACRERGHWRLHDAVLYVTLEPCAMCAGALVNARIARVVFGAWDAKAGALGSLYHLGEDVRLNHRFPSRGNVLHDACRDRLQAFFRGLRSLGQK